MRARRRAWLAGFIVVIASSTAPGRAAQGAEAAPPVGTCEQFGITGVTDSLTAHTSSFPGFAAGSNRLLTYSSTHGVSNRLEEPMFSFDGFRLDLVEGSRVQTTLTPSGGQIRNGAFGGDMSADGDRALFWTQSDDLGTHLQPQLFMREISTGRTDLVSANINGEPADGLIDQRAAISPDGRFVAFASQSFDMVPGDSPRLHAPQEVFLRDVDAGTTERVTGPSDIAPYGARAVVLGVTAGGRFVTFVTDVALTSADTSRFSGVYVWDRETKTFDLVTVDEQGRDMGGAPLGVSDDANTILFKTYGQDNSDMSLWARDRRAGTTRLIRKTEPSFEFSGSLSGDGRWAAIHTALPISPNDGDGKVDALLIDTTSGEIRPVEAADPSCSPSARFWLSALSYDGSKLAVATAWRDPPGGPPSDEYEIFLFDVAARSWQQVTPFLLGPFGGTAVPVPATPAPPVPTRDGTVSGYWMLTRAGAVHPFGAAAQHGSGGPEATDLEPTPSADGYWILQRNGAVTAHGDAATFGSAVLKAGEGATSLSATPGGRGYWVFTDRGRVLPFGEARFFGDLSSAALVGPVLDSVGTPSGNGYYMVASDGGIFAFGDARFAGSMGGRRLNKPVMSMAADPDGSGYWLVASDGGIFAFDAPFRGSMGATRLNRPISGIVAGSSGYLMVAEDGGVFAFGDTPFFGSLGGRPPPDPVVSVTLRRRPGP